MNKTCDIKVGKHYKVKHIIGDNLIKKRLNSLGIIENCEISIYKKAPLGGPIVLKVANYSIALRRNIFKNMIIEEI